jgi:hypothetical protein
MADNTPRLKCCVCNSDLTYDETTGEFVCLSCRYQLPEGMTQQGINEPRSIMTGGTLKPEVVTIEEVVRRTTQAVSPHSHDEFRAIQYELAELRGELEELKRSTSKAEVLEVPSKDVTLEEALPQIEDYLKTFFKDNAQVYPSDVADELCLKYDLVKEAFAVLEKQGKLKGV